MADDDGSEEAETGLTAEALPPAFMGPVDFSPTQFRRLMQEAVKGWLLRTPSEATQAAYKSDLDEFLRFAKIRPEQIDRLKEVRPEHVASWREQLQQAGRANSTIR